MNIDTTRYTRTRDGYPFRILATDLDGNLPVAVLVDGEIYRLDANLTCPDAPGMSLAEARREHTRFFNVYRAADGSFVFGSKAFETDYERRNTQDAQRAITGVCVTFNENARSFSTTAV